VSEPMVFAKSRRERYEVRDDGRRIHTRELPAVVGSLSAGERVLLSGTLYTARDAAHARLAALLAAGEDLPFPPGAVLYYAGPTPAPAGMPIGSCGPTTSKRMDPYTPALLAAGVCATVGKGERAEAVVRAIREYHSVYFCALGGAGALAARRVRACEVVAFADLGCEAVHRLEIEDFPVYVGVDSKGSTIFTK